MVCPTGACRWRSAMYFTHTHTIHTKHTHKGGDSHGLPLRKHHGSTFGGRGEEEKGAGLAPWRSPRGACP